MKQSVRSRSNMQNMEINDYKKLFSEESKTKSKELIEQFNFLQSSPNNQEIIAKMVLCADVIMGDSKFLQDEELQIIATNFLKSFYNATDISDKTQELEFFIHQFKD